MTLEEDPFHNYHTFNDICSWFSITPAQHPPHEMWLYFNDILCLDQPTVV